MGDSSGHAKKEQSFRRLPKPEEVPSVMTEDALIILRKKYFFPNDVIVRLPTGSERVCLPPAGYISVYEMDFLAGVRFPPLPELVAILKIFEICLSQLSCRALTIIIGLIVFFRGRKATLTSEVLLRILRFSCDSQGRVSCRSKRLDLRVKDPAKHWSGRFFYVQNDWGLQEKWGVMKELPSPLHIGDEDLLKLVDLPNFEELQYELRFMHSFVSEESLFKAGLSEQAGRSHAVKLKQSAKVVAQPIKEATSKKPRQANPEDVEARKRKRAEVPPAGRSSQVVVPHSDFLVKDQVPENVLKHSCSGLVRAIDLMTRRDLELSNALKEWNTEFVKVKYFQGEYKRGCQAQMKKVADLEEQLSGCRSELAALLLSYSSRSHEADKARDEAVEALEEISHLKKCLHILESKVKVLESENTRLSGLLTEKEIEADVRVVEDFKKSLNFRTIIQEHVQKERDKILNAEVKVLERQCREEGFLRGYLKAVRLVQRKTGADIAGLSPSQVSEDPSSDVGEEVESVAESDEISVG